MPPCAVFGRVGRDVFVCAVTEDVLKRRMHVQTYSLGRGCQVTDAVEAQTGTGDHRSDAALMQAVRQGDIAAYGVLYERHLGVARRVAATWAASHSERDDVVAEAFTRVLRVLRAGGGPGESFRAYLVATMRNTVISWRRHDSVVSWAADLPDGPGNAADASDAMCGWLHTLEAAEAVDAFASLPARWRMVLWHTEIEGAAPAHVAPRLGMTPNGVAALAYRARRGLRKAYLNQHLPDIHRPA